MEVHIMTNGVRYCNTGCPQIKRVSGKWVCSVDNSVLFTRKAQCMNNDTILRSQLCWESELNRRNRDE
jgi:hypothetical protein